MKTIENFKNEQISFDYAAKLYGGGPSVTVKITIKSNDGRAIFAADYVGKTFVDTTGGTSTTTTECENTDASTVECDGTATATN